MDTIKTSALTFIAIVACLMLLLTPDSFQHDVDVEASASSPQASAASLKHTEIPQFEPKLGVLVKSRKVIATIEKSQPNQVDKVPLILYPELAEIERTENLPPAEAFNTLERMLSNHDPVIRLAAIESLGTMKFPGLQATLVSSLPDPNPQLRVAALEALVSQDDKSVVGSIEPYLFDPDREVRVAAIEALADLESESAVYALAGLLSDQDRVIRHQAVDALGDIGGENALTYLLQARYDPNAKIRVIAEEILTELEYEAAN